MKLKKTGSWVVYIAGPFSGDKIANAKKFRVAARTVWLAGDFLPVDPIANSFDLDGLVADEEFVRRDLALVKKVDAVLLLKGWEGSVGAKKEEECAREFGIPIFHSVGSLASWFENKGR